MPEYQHIKQYRKLNNLSQQQIIPAKQIHISNPAAIIQHARADPNSLTRADVLQLQRTIGNRAVGRLLSEIRNPTAVQQAPIQRQKLKEEEICRSCLQRQHISEEQGPLQDKFESKPEKSICSSRSTAIVQRQELEEEESLQTKRENNTGMPDNLKAGVENLSGIDMNNVKVHYNSDKPAKVGALAYTQGTNIHVAPGQERHLPHEAWHVVQQAQGKVRPTMQLKGKAVNDDVGLEREADVMGVKALQMQRPNQVATDLSVQAETDEQRKAEQMEVLEIGGTSRKNVSLNFLSTAQRAAVVQMVKTTTIVKSFDDGKNLDVTYDPEKTLSQGAEGTVHVGTIKSREVIVKIAKEVGLAGMMNEIEILKNMQGGANIVGAIGYTEDGHILVLKKAETSLNRRIPRGIKGRMGLVLGSGRGVQSMHTQSFTHGDLNLKNILIQGGEAQLTDFGAATDFRDKNVVQKPIPQDIRLLIDQGVVDEVQTRQQYVVDKDQAMVTDRKDFIKVAVNILLGDTENRKLNDDKLVELERQLSMKGLAKISFRPIMELVRKSDPTAEDLERFLVTMELIIERMELQDKLVSIPAPNSISKKDRRRHYKQKRTAIQTALSINKKKLLAGFSAQ